MRLLLAALLFGGQLFAQATPAPPKEAAGKQELLWQKLEVTVAQADRELDGVLGVAIRDLTSGRTLLVNADEVFPQASSIKIAVLAELYRQAQQAASGAPTKASLKDLYTVRSEDLVPESDILAGLTSGVTRVTNRDLAVFMVRVSDNSATNILIDRLGMQNINDLLASLGLKNTQLRRKMLDLKAAREGRENTSTPREMMQLLESIYRGKLFNQALADDFFRVLSIPKERYMTRDLPEDLVVANKPGWLEGVRADSGIVFARNRPFVLCVMATYLRNERAGEQAISAIARAAYDYFDRLGRASPYGRLIP